MERSNVWSKDFTLIIVGTIISTIGGQTISLPMSLLVFDETGSTLLSAFLFISGMIPSVVLPILIAPIVDRFPKKRSIVGLDYLLGIIYLIVAVIIGRTGFNYYLYLGFSFLVGTIGTIYQLTYQAWFPDLIPFGFEQQGYAVSSSIYPSITIIMAPVAAFLYRTYTMSTLFVIIGVMTIIAATFELFITNIHIKKDDKKFDFKEYKEDLISGFKYLKKEKGLKNIYTYMAITNGTSHGSILMIQAYFQTVSFLTVTMLAFLRSAETIGRIIGGGIQYKIKVKAKKRYGITKFVYTVYSMLDGILLFMPYPLMIINRFICGFLGMTSATLRETSVQVYLPRHMRAKVNAVFNVLMALSLIVFQLFAGYLGDVLDHRIVVVLMASISLVSIYILIVKPTEENRRVYEAIRTENPMEEMGEPLIDG